MPAEVRTCSASPLDFSGPSPALWQNRAESSTVTQPLNAPRPVRACLRSEVKALRLCCLMRATAHTACGNPIRVHLWAAVRGSTSAYAARHATVLPSLLPRSVERAFCALTVALVRLSMYDSYPLVARHMVEIPRYRTVFTYFAKQESEVTRSAEVM